MTSTATKDKAEEKDTSKDVFGNDDSPEQEEAPETKTVNLYNVNDGFTGRKTGGPYLDRVELEEAELRRARIEDREPDLEGYDGNGCAGVNLVTAGQLVDNPQSYPPGYNAGTMGKLIDNSADDPDVGPNPVAQTEMPVTDADSDQEPFTFPGSINPPDGDDKKASATPDAKETGASKSPATGTPESAKDTSFKK